MILLIMMSIVNTSPAMNEKMPKDETKELNEKDTEKVTGGTIDWRHFPKEVRDAIEKEQQKDGGATGDW